MSPRRFSNPSRVQFKPVRPSFTSNAVQAAGDCAGWLGRTMLVTVLAGVLALLQIVLPSLIRICRFVGFFGVAMGLYGLYRDPSHSLTNPVLLITGGGGLALLMLSRIFDSLLRMTLGQGESLFF